MRGLDVEFSSTCNSEAYTRQNDALVRGLSDEIPISGVSESILERDVGSVIAGG